MDNGAFVELRRVCCVVKGVTWPNGRRMVGGWWDGLFCWIDGRVEGVVADRYLNLKISHLSVRSFFSGGGR